MTPPSILEKLIADLRSCADAEKAAFLPRFFKAGPGEYGEGDVFLGVSVPAQRKIAKQYADIPLDSLETLLDSEYHECRLTALLILVQKFEKRDEDQKDIAGFYLSHVHRVNNWDLVDLSAAKILGRYLDGRDVSILDDFAESGDLWKQRISIIATYPFIKRGEFEHTLRIAEKLLDHPHDLIHKAVGWMLREVGKQDSTTEERFLRRYCTLMPRTMLRYAIEKFDTNKRKMYLKGKVE
jgi:3-methyladenine DNA glycosylase AlkD